MTQGPSVLRTLDPGSRPQVRMSQGPNFGCQCVFQVLCISRKDRPKEERTKEVKTCGRVQKGNARETCVDSPKSFVLVRLLQFVSGLVFLGVINFPPLIDTDSVMFFVCGAPQKLVVLLIGACGAQRRAFLTLNQHNLSPCTIMREKRHAHIIRHIMFCQA